MTSLFTYIPYLLGAIAMAVAASVYARMIGYRLECLAPRRLGRSGPAEVPWLGGLVIVLAIAPLLGAIDPSAQSDIMFDAGKTISMRNGIFWGILTLFFWGVVIDRRGWSPIWVLFGQITAITIVCAAGVRVVDFRPLGLVDLAPGISFLITFVWLFVVMNFIRFLDGFDGLPELAASIIIALHLYYGGGEGWHFLPLLGMIFLGGLVGSLPFAFFPGRMYLGQNGNSIPGFLVGVISVVAHQKSILTVTFVLPAAIVFVTLSIIVLRLLERQLLLGDRAKG
jgi:UDP-N-acetylmuramyl pentapeptide phosphotransferase/UDP-N-acetylglucosamine-1-phosphate transferase